MFNRGFRQFVSVTGIVGLVGSTIWTGYEADVEIHRENTDCIVMLSPEQEHYPKVPEYITNSITAVTAVSTADAVSTSEVRLSDQTSSWTIQVRFSHPAQK